MSTLKLVVDARKAYDGGIGRYIRCLTAAMLEADDTLSLTLLMPPGMPSFLPASPRVARADHGSRPYSLAELATTAPRVARARASLFHEPHYVLPFRIGIPSVVTIHDTIHITLAEHLANVVERRYAHFMLRSSARRAAHVLTVSESARRDVIAHADLPPERVTATPLGVDPAFHDVSEAEGAAARRALGIEGAFVLYVGAFKPHKNPIGLCEAFAAARLDGATLVMVGGGTNVVDDWRAKSGAGARVVTASVDEAVLRGLYREARIFVLPSLYEGFGLPLLEAMAAGTPAIASRVASIPEVGGAAPRYVPPGDVGALAAALAALWSDADERRTRREAGRARARTFTWSRTAEATLDVYRRTIGAPAKVSP